MKRYYLIPLLFLSILVGSCMLTTLADKDSTSSLPVPAAQQQTAAALSREWVITAAGDIMMHDTQIKAGYDPKEDRYDYSSFYTYVKPFLDSADLTIGNLETTLAGSKAGYSGYPRFNAPEILAANLKEAGFDILTTANNHCLDKGQAGLTSTLDFLDQAGLQHTGTFRSPEERAKILQADVKGLQVAVLSYTYGTNGLTTAKGHAYSVNYLEPESIKSDINKARESGAQLIIAALHFGIEYQPSPNKAQQQLAQSLLDAGADIILGQHPHVLQPAFFYQKGSAGNKKFVIYSMGNFISDQKGLERRSSILLNLHIGTDPASQKPYLKKVTYLPIFTHKYKENGKTRFEVLPVEPALTSINTGSRSHLSAGDRAQLEDSWRHTTACLSSTDPDIQLMKVPIPLYGLSNIRDIKGES